MLGRLLPRLYTHLIHLYPDRFMDEFGCEMVDVFSERLAGLIDSNLPSIKRSLKMIRLFFREVWDFPLTYLDARRYQESLSTDETPVDSSLYSEGEVIETWVGRRAPWAAAFLGAFPFLLFGLAYLLEGFTELSGQYGPTFNLLGGNLLDRLLNSPAIIITPPMVVYFVSVLGLLFGILKGFPRWSYAYLGLSIYFGWYYGNGQFHNVVFGLSAWLPLFAAVILGLLINRSFHPLTQLFRGAWNDWTRLSFAFYAFALPIQTIIFFDGNWGIPHLISLVFDTVLLATVAVAFLRSHTTWGRVLSLEVAILIMVVKGLLMGWMGMLEGVLDWPVVVSIILLYIGLLLLPGVIGLMRRRVDPLPSR